MSNVYGRISDKVPGLQYGMLAHEAYELIADRLEYYEKIEMKLNKIINALKEMKSLERNADITIDIESLLNL